MNLVVIFRNKDTKFERIEDASEYQNDPKALINPDLSQVRGVPPNMWKRQGSQVVPMSLNERNQRKAEHNFDYSKIFNRERSKNK